ncbi:MAG: hypothetical protein AMJ59_12885 [Gammaproteobacteria bacterium SG8_31]|nr:MAG: hypothetical protein AMJ59_12885 [Gammaproteobacteria bacterium SG8_31]
MGLNPRFLPENPEELESLDFDDPPQPKTRKHRDEEARGDHQRRRHPHRRERHRDPDFRDD